MRSIKKNNKEVVKRKFYYQVMRKKTIDSSCAYICNSDNLIKSFVENLFIMKIISNFVPSFSRMFKKFKNKLKVKQNAYNSTVS